METKTYSKMTENYLRHMEEKIFHIHPDKQHLSPNTRRKSYNDDIPRKRNFCAPSDGSQAQEPHKEFKLVGSCSDEIVNIPDPEISRIGSYVQSSHNDSYDSDVPETNCCDPKHKMRNEFNKRQRECFERCYNTFNNFPYPKVNSNEGKLHNEFRKHAHERFEGISHVQETKRCSRCYRSVNLSNEQGVSRDGSCRKQSNNRRNLNGVKVQKERDKDAQSDKVFEEVIDSLNPEVNIKKEHKPECNLYKSQVRKELEGEINQQKEFPNQHERFETINFADPEIKLKESNVQAQDGRAKSSGKVGAKRSSSVPPGKTPLKLKNPRNADLFNPTYAFEKVNTHFSVFGRSLLESIRTKVLGFVQPNKNKEDGGEDSSYDSNSGDVNPALPKQARRAMTDSGLQCQRPRFCASCSKQIMNVRTVDAQTSPFPSATSIKVVGKKRPIIPCPLNLLCDRGIHIGKCEDNVREKTHAIVCKKDYSFKEQGLFAKDIRIYPGKAEPVRLEPLELPSEERATISLEGSWSDVSIGVEAKTSMETILKLLEPQDSFDSECPSDDLLPDVPNNLLDDLSVSRFCKGKRKTVLRLEECNTCAKKL